MPHVVLFLLLVLVLEFEQHPASDSDHELSLRAKVGQESSAIATMAWIEELGQDGNGRVFWRCRMGRVGIVWEENWGRSGIDRVN